MTLFCVVLSTFPSSISLEEISQRPTVEKILSSSSLEVLEPPVPFPFSLARSRATPTWPRRVASESGVRPKLSDFHASAF